MILGALIVAALNDWLVGWGRHLCDKQGGKVWLGRTVIFVCYLVDAAFVLAFFMLLDLKHFMGDT